jgi:hypothetical protein
MTRPHILSRGESLADVAAVHLGDAAQAGRLADFNGLSGVDDVVPGQLIHLPPRRERLAGKVRATPRALNPWPAVPDGLAAITATFGDIRQYTRPDGTAAPDWEKKFIGKATLPFAVPLDWDTSQSATSLRCHKLLVPLFERVFADIVAEGLRAAVHTYGGAYNWRMKRGQAKASTHSWGIAIDLNARTNGMGRPGDMDPALVALFERHGFVWGGRWSGANKDPMHFQYCSGY